MTRSFFFLFFLLQIFSSSYTQNSTNNLFENADQICYDQVLISKNLNANKNNTSFNINFDSLISCFNIYKSTWYRFTTNEFGGNAQLNISSIECSGDSNILYQRQLQAAVFSFSNTANYTNFFLLDSCQSSDNQMLFNLNNLLPNHHYYVLINGFSMVDTLQLNATCSYNINLNGAGVKPHFSAGEDIFVLPNTIIQLNAFGSGTPTWAPGYLFDNVNSLNPTTSLGETTELLLNLLDFNNCLYSDRLTIYVEVPLDFYNVITPNNDGYNDYWRIDNIENYPFCRIYIYDIFGSEVFSSIGYNENQRWDGTNDGSPLNSGTYYYFVNLGLPINNTIHKGSITLLK